MYIYTIKKDIYQYMTERGGERVREKKKKEKIEVKV
jgi:hypothetical protein